MSDHANSHDNQSPHHLYEIRDVARQNVYKYGISGDPLLPDGSSPRANRQVREFNRLVGWWRFFANVLLENIAGRAVAEKIEDDFIDAFKKQHGKRPDGNPPRKK